MTNLPIICVMILAINVVACNLPKDHKITLSHGIDESAGGTESYIIATPTATYYLDKVGGGLSSMIDRDGIDWLGFHNAPGSGHKGEYRGFPNAVHKQDGNYFHAMNAKTDASTSRILKESVDHIKIKVTSGNKKWHGIYDFYPDRLDFTMSKVSHGYKYWVQYEGVPGGQMDSTDYWMSSVDQMAHPIQESFLGDLPSPEWMAFGDENIRRVIYIFHHNDDRNPDNYVSRPDMTVLGFGRHNKDKFLTEPETFSIGFLETTNYRKINESITAILAEYATAY